MNHRTTPGFWQLYNTLPREIRELANKNYALLRADPSHPSLRFREIFDDHVALVGAAGSRECEEAREIRRPGFWPRIPKSFFEIWDGPGDTRDDLQVYRRIRAQ